MGTAPDPDSQNPELNPQRGERCLGPYLLKDHAGWRVTIDEPVIVRTYSITEIASGGLQQFSIVPGTRLDHGTRNLDNFASPIYRTLVDTPVTVGRQHCKCNYLPDPGGHHVHVECRVIPKLKIKVARKVLGKLYFDCSDRFLTRRGVKQILEVSLLEESIFF